MHYHFFSLIRPYQGWPILLTLIALFICLPLAKGDTNSDYFLYGDFIHKNNIQTVLFNQKGFELSDPLMRMNSNDRLILRFDDLDADYKNYYYTIIHCDANWEPSGLQQYEYIEGFYEDQIRDYRRSVNTRVAYTHYYLEFPGPNLQPTKSGNYILKVYLNGDRDNVVFTRRFSVYEQRVSLDGRVTQANLVRYRDRKQQVSFTIHTGGYNISNPYRDIQVVIRQNGRWDNAITDLEPRTIMGNELVYDYEDKMLFEGGNEFRHLDIRSLRYLAGNIADIQSSRRFWDVYLLPDKLRTYDRYYSEDDLNGRFQVLTQDARHAMTESDYAWVHFHLPMDAPLAEGHIHVMGALTNWHMSEDNKMNYNYGENAYELSLLLKQGYYNYQYAYMPEGATTADVPFIEGSHSQTENDYTVYVFHRRPGDLYDRLIGINHMNPAVP